MCGELLSHVLTWVWFLGTWVVHQTPAGNDPCDSDILTTQYKSFICLFPCYVLTSNSILNISKGVDTLRLCPHQSKDLHVLPVSMMLGCVCFYGLHYIEISYLSLPILLKPFWIIISKYRIVSKVSLSLLIRLYDILSFSMEQITLDYAFF